MLGVVKFVLIFVSVCVARELSDEELHRLPKLFHLDDYNRCLSQRDGVYCLGTFELTPKTVPNPTYDIIKEQLKQHFSFDRRLLHRGYCLSKRCQTGELNTTLRFEQCAERFIRKHGLKARLSKLSYCTTHAQRNAKLSEAPDLPQRVFLYVVYLILFLNVLGTVHDVYWDGKKNKHLVAWSIPANWNALTTVSDGDSRFAPVQSSKIILHCIIIYTHAYLLHFMGYMHNPEAIEKARDSIPNVIIRNGTSLVQVFILISSFFTGHNVLQTARQTSIGTGLAVRWILKRIFRLAPVYLLLSAYSATWWSRAGDGPLWTLVEAETQVCRKKFWTHVLFLNNFVEPSQLCMVQSWAMAAEVQLFLVSLLLTLLLIKLKVRAVPVLAVMFTVSCLFNVTLAYVAGLVPMVKVIVPETLRTEFRGSRSFFHLHTSPWSNLPACLLGLLLAHVYFEQKNKIKAKEEDRKETNGIVQNGLKHENVTLVNGNGVVVYGNRTDSKENAVIYNQNGGHVTENYIPFNGNGVHINENCLHVKENCAYVKENGAYVEENGVHVEKNSVHVKENGVHVKENGVHVKENGVHVKENGVHVKENGVHVKENGVHVKENGVHVKENGVHVKENDVYVNGIGQHAEDGLRNRKNVTDDIKSSNVISAASNNENKSNGIINGVINQNGQTKLSGYENQNGSSLENKDKSHKKRASFLLRYAHFFTLPTLIVWVVAGSRVTSVESSPVIALYVGLERLIFSLAFACQLLQIITVKGPWARLLSRRGWAVPARLALCVAMVHWCVNASMLAARPLPVASSLLNVSIDWLATLFYSYMIALPLCILVELPMKRALDALIS